MEAGTKVVAEILSHGKPEKLRGTIVAVRNGEYDIRPEGFESLTITVAAKDVHEQTTGTKEITQPKLNYKKK